MFFYHEPINTFFRELWLSFHDAIEAQDEVLNTMKNMLAKQKEKLERVSSKLNQSDETDGREQATKETRTNTKVQLPDNCTRFQFPEKLYAMLETFGSDSDMNIVFSWLAHGRAFKINDEHHFIECIVPMFFKQTQIRSFYRQLLLWGFKRSDAIGAWYGIIKASCGVPRVR